MERRALLVGIDTYQNVPNLKYCVADVNAMRELLSRDQDGTLNYDCKTLADQTIDGKPLTRAALRRECEELFSPEYNSSFR